MGLKKQQSQCQLKAASVLCCLGHSSEEIWPGLIKGDSSYLENRDDLWKGQTRLFGRVSTDLPKIPKSLSIYDCWNNQIALAALEMIREELTTTIKQYGAHRIGVVVGSSTSGFAETENAFAQYYLQGTFPSKFDLAQFEFGGLSEFIAKVAGVTGPSYALSTACSAGAKALVTAKTLLELNFCDAVICGGVDTLCQFTANGFGVLEALSRGHTNPMSKNRDGLNLGEGGALFLITRDPGGIQLLGGGESSDAHHMSAPQPEGLGAEKAMGNALKDAGLEANQISYINLHGTGTPLNDSMESKAVERVFGQDLPCSTTKPLTGHTLGASGAIEAAFLWMILQNHQNGHLHLPPHLYDGHNDPEIGAIKLVENKTAITNSNSMAFMSNSFGFGGSNCSLIIGRGKE